MNELEIDMKLKLLKRKLNNLLINPKTNELKIKLIKKEIHELEGML